MSTGLEDIRKFRGKPWSAWTDFIGFKVPPGKLLVKIKTFFLILF